MKILITCVCVFVVVPVIIAKNMYIKNNNINNNINNKAMSNQGQT